MDVVGMDTVRAIMVVIVVGDVHPYLLAVLSNTSGQHHIVEIPVSSMIVVLWWDAVASL